MSFWHRFLQALILRFPIYQHRKSSRQVSEPESLSLQINPELNKVLHQLATQEQRSTKEVTADLLAYAVQQLQASEENQRRWVTLTRREKEVVALISLNFTNEEIAERLFVSSETVKTHIRNIFYKYDIHSKSELRQMLAGWDFDALGNMEDPQP